MARQGMLPLVDPGGSEVVRQRWLHLTGVEMPALAKERRWPVRADHCFRRILLDNACGGRWYDTIHARPAWMHATPALLARAIGLGEAVMAGTADLHCLNRRSLAWRHVGKTVGTDKEVAADSHTRLPPPHTPPR